MLNSLSAPRRRLVLTLVAVAVAGAVAIVLAVVVGRDADVQPVGQDEQGP